MTPRCKIYCPINAYSVVVVVLPFMGTINNSSGSRSATSQTESEGGRVVRGRLPSICWDRDRPKALRQMSMKVGNPFTKKITPS